MEKKDFHFTKQIAYSLSEISTVVTDILEQMVERGQYAFSYTEIDKFRNRCMNGVNEAEKHADELGKELVKAITTFIEDIFSYEIMDVNVEKDEATCVFRDKDVFVSDSIRLSSFHLSNTIAKYEKEKGLHYYGSSSSFTKSNEFSMALLFREFQFFLTEFDNLEKKISLDYFCDFQKHMEDDLLGASSDEFYLLKNKKGQIICFDKDERKYAYVMEKDVADKIKHMSLKGEVFCNNYLMVNKDELNDLIKNTRDEYYASKKKEKELANQKKKETIKKPTVKKRKRLNLKALLSFGDGLTVGNILLGILPMLVMITYLILLVTGVMDQITFSSSSFNLTLFGYDFELSGLMSNWLENTDHGFFSAITLGLIQVILIVIGFVLDLVIHFIFLLLALLLIILTFIFAYSFYYVLPVIVAVWSIIYFFRVDDDKRVLIGICMGISVICCVSYFLIGMNVI